MDTSNIAEAVGTATTEAPAAKNPIRFGRYVQGTLLVAIVAPAGHVTYSVNHRVVSRDDFDTLCRLAAVGCVG